MPQLAVSVAVDFAGVTYNNRAWGGSPSFTVSPSSLQVHNGNNNITWTLTATNVPAGCTAAFPAVGVVFKTTNDPPWVGTTPTTQSDGTVTASDNFSKLDSALDFAYSTIVQLTNTADGTTTQFTYDPDVENESGDQISDSLPAPQGQTRPPRVRGRSSRTAAAPRTRPLDRRALATRTHSPGASRCCAPLGCATAPTT